MITILHGDQAEASRARLNEIIRESKGKEIRRIDGKNTDAGELTQAIEASSLFGGDLVVVFERLFGSLGKKQKLAVQYAAILSKATSDVILLEEKELSPTALAALGSGAKVELFKTPRIIFEFLDGLRPGSAKTSLALYGKLVKTEAPELVFSMIVKRVRQMVMLKDKVTAEGLQGWQVGRLTNQAGNFTMEQLLKMHKNLLDIEFSLKTGASPFTLTQLTQQWLVWL